MRAVFWISGALLVYAQAGYGLLVGLLAMRWPRRSRRDGTVPQRAALIIAAHDEQEVIAAKVRNARALEWADLQVVVACDGCTDATADRARAAGAGVVLELPRGGRGRAPDAGGGAGAAAPPALSGANP